MKMKLSTFLAAAALWLVLLAPAPAELHEFNSADGIKTFWANLTNYDAKKDLVSVRRGNGRQQVFPASLLSEEDREWVKQQYEIIKIGRHVKIEATARHGNRKITKSSNQKQIETSKYFDIKISNSSREEVSGLTVQYEVHVTQGGREGVIKGEAESISALYSGVPHQFKSTEVNLSQKIPLSTATGAAGCST